MSYPTSTVRLKLDGLPPALATELRRARKKAAKEFLAEAGIKIGDDIHFTIKGLSVFGRVMEVEFKHGVHPISIMVRRIKSNGNLGSFTARLHKEDFHSISKNNTRNEQ